MRNRRQHLIVMALAIITSCMLGSSVAEAACPTPFCDSTRIPVCITICPLGDIPYVVTVKDSCGAPQCDLAGTYLDLAGCNAIPCPGAHPNWPLVFADSCDPATGRHFFHVKAGQQSCQFCPIPVYVNGAFCAITDARFLDSNGDLCVTQADWVNNIDCNDYDCDLQLTAADQNFLASHFNHCCSDDPCPPGPAFCDSTVADPCVVICPLGDIPYSVFVKDSCGNPICDTAGTFLDFSGCPTIPCPTMTSWPAVKPDSCDPATGEHFFTIAAGSLDCIDCGIHLFVGGTYCRDLIGRFLDINGDLCVTGNDFLPALPCNDYNCDGTIGSDDAAIHAAHLGHCCDAGCPPGPPFCDSTMFDPCLVICPQGDIPYSVFLKDSCGNPVCDLSGTWLDFSTCPTIPCPTQVDWPIVKPDSCDPATGEHFFTLAAGSLDCIDCMASLFVNSAFCRGINAKFLDINGDLCVTGNDWLPAMPCNDYNCNGTIDSADFAIHSAHLGHCCDGAEIHGHKFHDLNCNGVWDAGEPALSGWQINLYQGGSFIGSTVTNTSGQYWFTGLPSGNYQVTENIPGGWIQTFPASVYHYLFLPPSAVLTGIDFGNKDTTCDYTPTTWSQVDGTVDNFTGPEPSSPSASLIAQLTCPLGYTNMFDTPLSNQCFGHTMTGWDTTCCILGAQLCLRVTATGVIPSTDGLVFFQDSVAIWGITMNNLQNLATSGADPTWSSGDTLFYCFDLANLPPSTLGVTNVLAALADGSLDIRFQDDTMVDFLEMSVTLCCAGCCDIPGDVNDDGSGPDIADLVYLVAYMFGGGPAPPCLEQADINGDGSGPDIADLVYLVNFMFGGGPPPAPCP